MSLEAIITKIQKDAELEAAAILEAAEDEKRMSLEKHASGLEEDFRRETDRIRSRVKESRKKKEFHVRREAARKLMNARRTMMDRAIDRAVDSLADADDEVYLKLISSLLLGCDLRGDIQVVISRRDEKRITGAFLDKHSGRDRKFVLSDERHDLRGGIIFRSGDISQNGTFPMIAELAHEELIMELSGLVPLEKPEP